MARKPLLDPDAKHVAHENVCVLEVGSKKEMERLLKTEDIRSIIWARFDDIRALVNPARVHELKERLAAMDVRARYRDDLELEDGA